MVELTPLKNMNKTGNLPQIGVKILKKKWKHHPEHVCQWISKGWLKSTSIACTICTRKRCWANRNRTTLLLLLTPHHSRDCFYRTNKNTLIYKFTQQKKILRAATYSGSKLKRDLVWKISTTYTYMYTASSPTTYHHKEVFPCSPCHFFLDSSYSALQSKS